MTEAVELLHSRSEAQWWNRKRSLGDIAEHLERTFKDKQKLERKLTEVLEENRQLKSKAAGPGRHQAELAMRERLLKDEFERKTQELRLEMNKERRELVERVEQLKKELEGCFCRQHSNENVVHVKNGPDPQMRPKTPRVR